ncbi:MAG TPA: hypothetical protein DCQ06_13830 [Myxococcales bacterium]|nr:hypothetical protein [Myxococcales bacterium]
MGLCAACSRAVDAALTWRVAQIPIFTGWVYGGPLADWMKAQKFQGQSGDLRPWIEPMIRELRDAVAPGDLLVPVAPHLERLVSRGRHLPDEIARHCGAALGLSVSYSALIRVDRQPVRSQFPEVEPEFTAQGVGNQRVWLIDDIVTTGTTLRQASAALQRIGADVQGAICLADAKPLNTHPQRIPATRHPVAGSIKPPTAKKSA